MLTRQMPSAVSSGRIPLCRSTRRRIMSASRAGRNADPDSVVRFACMSRPMISPRSMSRRCIASSMRSISRRSSASGGGGAVGLILSVFFGRGAWAPWGPPERGAGGQKRKKSLTARPARRHLRRSPGRARRPNPGGGFGSRGRRQLGGPESQMVELRAVAGRIAVAREREADQPHSPVAAFGADQPLRLDAGVELNPFQVAYQAYGALNADRSNAVLICHALTGDQHVSNHHPVTGKSGWWDTMVGPGKPIDTNRYYVICPNVLGACMGTTGPASTNPRTGVPWGLDFPVITIRDMVQAQAMLLDRLGIDTLFAVAGGSM